MFSRRSKSSSLSVPSLTTSSRSVSATDVECDSSSPSAGSAISSCVRLDLVEARIVFHLLLDAFLQRHQRQLQNFHRLDHPRCKHLLLSQLHLLAKGKSHDELPDGRSHD